MPNHYFFHLLNSNPIYANSRHRLSYLNKNFNPKAHGGSGLIRRHQVHHAHHIHHAPRHATVGEGAAVHHTKRRPAPLKFRI